MRYRRTTVSVFYIASLLFVFSFVFFGFTKAQSLQQPQFLFSWRASNSYVPSFYNGKDLPGSQSQITASFELISGGKVVNIANQSIYWYLDDVLIGGGAGVQQITFSPFGTAPASEDLRVELPSYPGDYLIHEVNIPVMNPLVVINSPYPNNQFSGTNATATALSYFFNTQAANLSFVWSVNGQSGSNAENPDILQINMPAKTPSGSTIAISLQVQNSQNNQSADTSEDLTYQNQLQ